LEFQFYQINTKIPLQKAGGKQFRWGRQSLIPSSSENSERLYNIKEVDFARETICCKCIKVPKKKNTAATVFFQRKVNLLIERRLGSY
jgi:hypothetical protein